jgi:DNA-binding GntR family transcriptional regulator
MIPLSPITAPYLRDQAFQSLREAIVAGVLPPAAPIVIDDLAETLGLSAMPVREAVKRLVADGLVEELPRRAHRVAPLTRQSALDVLEIVGTLMIRAYELGVPRLDEEDVAAMRAALDAAAAEAASGDLTAALAGVHAMHAVVYRATGNPEFERTISAIGPRFDRVLYLWYTESVIEVDTSYRRDLVVELERGRRADAVEIMRGAWGRFRDVIASHEEAADEA